MDEPTDMEDCPHCGAITPDYCERPRCEWNPHAFELPSKADLHAAINERQKERRE